MIIKKRIALFFLMLAFCFTVGGQAFLSAFSITASAASEDIPAIEESDPLDDLNGAVICDEEFSTENFSFNTSKSTQMIAFYEYGYGFYENEKEDLNYYVYIYNPKCLRFVEDGAATITFAVVYDETELYVKYNLSFLNCSEATNYEGLIYKLKVDLSSSQRENLWNSLNSSKRNYRVSEIRLAYTSASGETYPELIDVSTTFTYSGYMPGYGTNESGETTVSYTSEEFDTISLDVKSTYFRSLGTNNNGNQDTLHSVYFAVPNEFIAKYGEMTAVHATWLNAVLKPALVTGNKDAYNALLSYLGENIGEYCPDLDYSYISNFSDSDLGGIVYYGGDVAYNYRYYENCPTYFFNKPINTLYLMFSTDDFAENSADNYSLSSEKVISAMANTYPEYGGTSYTSKLISSSIFESIDDSFTEVNISSDTAFSLENNIITQSWWQKLWGTNTTVSGSFNGIKAIERITASSFTDSIEGTCSSLYINEADYESFLSAYNASRDKDSTFYIFRYQVSEYISGEATCVHYYDGFLGADRYEKLDTNAYFFQQTVNLDFDIIDVTFSNGEKETVVPVVMESIDVITPDATPPTETTPDIKLPDFSGLFSDLKDGFNDFTDILSLILGGIGIAAIVFIIIVIIRFAGIVFEPIVWLFKAIFKKKE